MGAVGSTRERHEGTARGWREDKGGTNNAVVIMQPVKKELIKG